MYLFVLSLIWLNAHLFYILSICVKLYRPDTQRIFVDVGLGFHVEFTWSEALNYIAKREEKIARYKFSVSISCLVET